MQATDGSRPIQSSFNDGALRTFSTAPAPGQSETAISVPCPLCGITQTRGLWIAQGVAFKRCRGCGLWRQDPQPRQAEVLARYGDQYLEYETARHMEYREISLRSLGEAGLVPAASVTADGRQRSILEIGCATGALLSAFAEAGWSTTGVETGASMSAYARATFGLDVRTGTIESADLPRGSFDVVIATHLLEHLNDPESFLQAVLSAMRTDGCLFLITPNADGFQARIMRAQWRSAIRDHLFLFSKRTLTEVLATAGFKVDYMGTWGGWPVGMRPAALKRPLDSIAKRLGWGDVMVVRASLIESRRWSQSMKGACDGS